MPAVRPALRRLLVAAALLVPLPALAHPHVWVTTKAVLEYAPDGALTGVRHAWTFDPGYSAYAAQGLGAAGDGKATPDELAPLARENVESLAESGYFTRLKAGSRKLEFDAPREPRMSLSDGRLTLSFLLPLKAPTRGTAVTLEVYDPTYFVSFSLAPGDDAAQLAGAPAECRATLVRPKTEAASAAPTGALNESFFAALTAAADYGIQFANRIIVACR
jgi:ABC-type uncharacterized transport system substrate-binding protein